MWFISDEKTTNRYKLCKVFEKSISSFRAFTSSSRAYNSCRPSKNAVVSEDPLMPENPHWYVSYVVGNWPMPREVESGLSTTTVTTSQFRETIWSQRPRSWVSIRHRITSSFMTPQGTRTRKAPFKRSSTHTRTPKCSEWARRCDLLL